MKVDKTYSSTTLSAAINLSKLCIGAGTLALPHATFRGGLLFAPFFIGLVALWNGIACSMIIRCKQACVNTVFPDNLSSTFSKIAFAGAGRLGVWVTDFSIIVTLIGVCISYQITFATLLRQTLGNEISITTLTVISGIIVYPASCAKDVGALSIFSFAGLICLVCGVISILVYGSYEYGGQAWTDPLNVIKINNPGNTLVLWPLTIADATSYVGVATFCFGLCSMAFPVEESMIHRHEFKLAVKWCLIFVWSVYFILGDVGAMLYAQDANGIQENILSNLPQFSPSATLVKLSMAMVCLLTFPLTCVPPAQMIEQIILHTIHPHVVHSASNAEKIAGTMGVSASLLSASIGAHNHNYQSINTSAGDPNPQNLHNVDDDQGDNTSNENSPVNSIAGGDAASDHQNLDDSADSASREPTTLLRCGNRLVLVIISTMIASSIPCFGVVVSLIGCFTVTILSFILPAYLHLQLVTRPQLHLIKLIREHRLGVHGATGSGENWEVSDGNIELARYRNALPTAIETDLERQHAALGLDHAVLNLTTHNMFDLTPAAQYYVDVGLFVCGVVLCVVATTMTSIDAWNKVQQGALC